MRRRGPLLFLALAVAVAGCRTEGPTGPGSADAPVDAVVVPDADRSMPAHAARDARSLHRLTPSALSRAEFAGQAEAVLARHREATAAAPPALTFPVVTLRQGPGNPGSHGAPVVSNLADALSRVASGGEIRVHPGSYLVDESVVVDKSVTIEGPARGGAEFVIDGPGARILVSGEGPGSVATFRNLSFVNGETSVGLAPTGDYDQVVIDGSSFHIGPTSGTLSIAIAPFSSTVPGATVTVTNSSFTSVADASFPAHGIQVIPGATLNVSGSSFGPLNALAVWYRPGTSGTVQGSDFDDCGRFGCAIMDSALFDDFGNFIGIDPTEVDLLDNRFFQPNVDRGFVFGDGPIEYFSAGSAGTVSGNLVEGCGRGECVVSIFGASIELVDNQFEIPFQADFDDRTRFGVTAFAGGSIIATGNTITGIGGSPGNRPVMFAALHIGPGSSMTLDDNRVENAPAGIFLETDAAVDGLNNVIDDVDRGIQAFGTGIALDLRSSDFTNYGASIEADHLPLSGSDLTCNWWDDAGGPQSTSTPSGFDAFYTPWAAGPVAGTSTSSCSGGV